MDIPPTSTIYQGSRQLKEALEMEDMLGGSICSSKFGPTPFTQKSKTIFEAIHIASSYESPKVYDSCSSTHRPHHVT
ncbi:hypothetical protein N7537_010730 [Penicillium hordei]|uniref:Uncharacterized protein n=1 Tax=Penicillium hordei TaxID=40994 RepID=A0AAD6DKI6_9EURO|nr:uncharacterized protein N7537_010730 [Penicillium hordei]KAJ5588052.1 hypothetical protein N7537_010730 [Penicillium hordei]